MSEITPEERALVDAAVAYYQGRGDSLTFARAVRAYQASIKPPDPIAELIAAAQEAERVLRAAGCISAAVALDTAIAAAEAARKEKSA